MEYGFDRITDRIYLGGQFESPDDVAALKAVGITRVINCREVQDPDYVLAAFKVCWPQPAKADDGTPRGQSWFSAGAYFWGPTAMTAERTYVHCHAGMERSHAMTMLLVCLLGLSMDDARHLIVIHRLIDVLGVRYLDEVAAYLKVRE